MADSYQAMRRRDQAARRVGLRGVVLGGAALDVLDRMVNDPSYWPRRRPPRAAGRLDPGLIPRRDSGVPGASASGRAGR